MLAFFRRALSSWYVLGMFALLLVGLIITGVGTPSSLAGLGGDSGSGLVKVGREELSQADVEFRLKNALEGIRQRQPTISMPQLIQLGGLEQTIDGMTDGMAATQFAEAHGMNIGRRLIDGEISSNRDFFGASGKFDDNRFQEILSRGYRVTEEQYRTDLKQKFAQRWLLAPVSAAPTVPAFYAQTFASMALERRIGSAIAIPASAYEAGAAPNEAEIGQFYNANKDRYIVPETRAIRYATFDRSIVADKAKPTDAELAAYYKANAANYAASEQRALSQVIVADEATAKKIAASGSLSAGAKAAGLEALDIKPLDQKTFAGQSSEAVAKAAFSAAKGATAAPVKSGLGWHVVKVTDIIGKPARTLDQVKGEITPIVAKEKTEKVFKALVDQMITDSEDGATLDEIAKKNNLSPTVTPDISADGKAPKQPSFMLAKELAPLVKQGFLIESSDKPQAAALDKEHFVLFHLDRVTPSAPSPLAEIKARVMADLKTDRASKSAKKVAEAAMAKSNAGTPLAQAIAAAGAKSGGTEALNATRLEIIKQGDKAKPVTKLMFALAPGRTKLLEMPDGKGWYLVRLDQIIPGDASKDQKLIDETADGMRQGFASEYAAQFTNAAKAELKVKKNSDAISAMKQRLLGQGSGGK